LLLLSWRQKRHCLSTFKIHRGIYNHCQKKVVSRFKTSKHYYRNKRPT